MTMHDPGTQWAAETIAERWPSNPKGAFYLIMYGASPARIDNLIKGDDHAVIEELLAKNVVLRTQNETLSRGNKSYRKTTERHADELNRERSTRVGLEGRVGELSTANMELFHDLRDMRQTARRRAEERDSKERQNRQRASRKATSERDGLKSHIERLQKQLKETLLAKADRDGVNTFMGMPVADAAEAMIVAEELARSVHRPTTWGAANEIAKRFLKLRTPPTPKPVIKFVKFACPECGSLAGEEGANGKATHHFCENDKCLWRCAV